MKKQDDALLQATQRERDDLTRSLTTSQAEVQQLQSKLHEAELRHLKLDGENKENMYALQHNARQLEALQQQLQDARTQCQTSNAEVSFCQFSLVHY